jgi:hypothetical protein
MPALGAVEIGEQAVIGYEDEQLPAQRVEGIDALQKAHPAKAEHHTEGYQYHDQQDGGGVGDFLGPLLIDFSQSF